MAPLRFSPSSCATEVAGQTLLLLDRALDRLVAGADTTPLCPIGGSPGRLAQTVEGAEIRWPSPALFSHDHPRHYVPNFVVAHRMSILDSPRYKQRVRRLRSVERLTFI
jgi:hypothetical protein